MSEPMDLRAIQQPLKQAYRVDADRAKLTLKVSSQENPGGPMACSVDIGRAIVEAQAHAGVGGAGTAACSGDLLLGSLAGCAQITAQMVAAALGLPVAGVTVTVEGDLDLRGTLGIDPQAPVGFQAIRAKFVVAGDLSEPQRRQLRRLTEGSCVVLATLTNPPPIEVSWEVAQNGE